MGITNKKLVLLLSFILSMITVSAQVNQSAPMATATDTVTTIANKNMPEGMEIYAMAKVAAMHNYPLPYDVLTYQHQLMLEAAQLKRLNAIIQTLNLKKIEISQSMAMNEKALSQLFANRKVNDGSVIFLGNRYGLYEGEMRTAVLTACYQTAQVLTPRQITKFAQMQGHSN